MELKFQTFVRAQFYEAQRSLFSICFPENAGSAIESEDHYNWKFQKFPAIPSSYEYSATDGTDLVGYYAALPFNYTVKNQKLTCGMVCDVMTHPGYRGAGIFTKLGRYATENLAEHKIDFVSGYPIRPEVIPGHLKVGWFIAFQQPMYLRMVKLNFLFTKLGPLKKLSIIFNFLLRQYNFLFNCFSCANYQTSILNRGSFLQDNDYDSFFKLWSDEQEIFLNKNKAFLAWRTGAPGTEYQFVKLSKNNEMVGLAITRKVLLQEIPSLAILDLMILNSHQRGLKNLFIYLYQLAKSDCDLLVTMASPYIRRKYRFLENGFVRSHAVFSIIFKILNSQLNKQVFKDESKWHLMWIDSDDL